jgi:hypothetical protein
MSTYQFIKKTKDVQMKFRKENIYFDKNEVMTGLL